MIANDVIQIRQFTVWNMDKLISMYEALEPEVFDLLGFQKQLDSDGQTEFHSALVNGRVRINVGNDGLTISYGSDPGTEFSEEEGIKTVGKISDECIM